MDFTNGYGIDYLKRAERKFTLRDTEITLEDSFTLTRDSEITERFVALIEPRLSENGVIIDDSLLECGITPKISSALRSLNIIISRAHITHTV